MVLVSRVLQRETITYYPPFTQTWGIDSFSADCYLDIHNVFGPIATKLSIVEANVQTKAIRAGYFRKVKLQIISGTLTSNLTLNTSINGVDSSNQIVVSSMSAATYDLTPIEAFNENDLLSIHMNSGDNSGTHVVRFAIGIDIQYIN